MPDGDLVFADEHNRKELSRADASGRLRRLALGVRSCHRVPGSGPGARRCVRADARQPPASAGVGEGPRASPVNTSSRAPGGTPWTLIL